MGEDNFSIITIVAGIGSIVVLVCLLFVVISTIDSADLLKATSYTTVANETGYINSTIGAYTLATFSTNNRDYFIIDVHTNATGILVPSANYTFNPVNGQIVNATATSPATVNITYGYYSQTRYENASDSLGRVGFVEGTKNVSKQVPTILLISAVILLFGLLVLLVAKTRQMSITGGGGSGSVGTSVSGEGPAGSL